MPTGLDLLLGFANLLQNPQRVMVYIEQAKAVQLEVEEKIKRLGILEDAGKVMSIAEAKLAEADRRLDAAQEFDADSKARAERREQLFIAKDQEQNKALGEKWAALKAAEQALTTRESSIAAREATVDRLRKEAETLRAQTAAAHVAAEERLRKIRDAAASLGS